MLYPLISSYLIRNCMAIIREFDEGLNKLTEQESENLVFKRRVISKCTLYRVFHMSYVSCNNTKLNTLHSNQLRIFCTKYTESCRFNMIIKPVLSKPGKLKGCLEHSAQKSIIISLIVSYSIIGLSILISFNDRLSILKETNQV